jgi:hypothetical protein
MALILDIELCEMCEKFYKTTGDYCTMCFDIIDDNHNPVYKQYDLLIYNNIKDTNIKFKYFNKYINKFWGDFNKYLGNTYHIIRSYIIVKNILDKAIITSHNNNNIGILFGILNGLYPENIYSQDKTNNAFCFPAKIIDEYLSMYITHNKNLFPEEKTNFLYILGQSVLNPWCSSNKDILKHFGNNGNIPNTYQELFESWFNNKKKVIELFGNHIIYKCNCGFTKDIKSIDITKSNNYNHEHKDLDIDILNQNINKMKI